MKHGSSFVLTCAASVAALLITAVAYADPPPPTGIWVDAQPWTCSSEIGPFARHVELACDALGSPCTVAANAKAAAFRATLSCADPDAWTLEVQKIDGASVLTLALQGDREQRLRKAAMWTAHASIGEPPPRKAARVAAAPPPAPEPEPEPVAAPEPPAPVVIVAPPQQEPQDDVEYAPRRQEPRGGLTLSGFGGVSNARRGDPLVGGRASAAFGLGHGVYVGPSFNYAHGVDGAALNGLYLGGLALGVGAPFGGRWLGATVEGGAGASMTGHNLSFGRDEMRGASARSLAAKFDRDGTRGVGFARAALILQAPVDFAIRPTLSVAAMHVSDVDGSAAQIGMIDLGVAWPGW